MSTVLEPSLDRTVAESSDRSFGFVFGVMFAVIACLPLLHGHFPRWWALGVGGAFAIVALIRPQLLHPLNRAWLFFGRLLHRVVSPLVLSIVFFVSVTPIGWFMRWRGKDLLSLKRQPDLKSYWIDREPSPPDAQSMRNQY